MNVSYCTNCKDRRLDLGHTLGPNLRLLAPGEEIVLLDYNSRSDGLRDWALSEFAADLDAGRLRLYSETAAPRFFMAHAKNVCHLLGGGRVLVNLDADNTLDPDFLRQVRGADWGGLGMMYPLAGSGGFKGRTAFRKDVFLKMGGYDEDLRFGYGHEEICLYHRCRAAGVPWAELRVDPRSATPTPEAHKAAGQLDPRESIAVTNHRHKALSRVKLHARQYVANAGREWGRADLVDRRGRAVAVYALGGVPHVT